MLAWISDPTAWAGLFALVTLEVVLGIDNLVFIAILAERVEPRQRNRARVTGLLMALALRLILLSAMTWLIKLTKPLFSIAGASFSGRDIIFVIGGIFLLFKATSELHERLEGVPTSHQGNRQYANFWTVVIQIMVLDAVFSLDAVITAVGMVEHLGVMMTAVIIAMSLMLIASKPLTKFVNAHPTVVVLCLSFLLMIGFSLVVEGFGFHVPKGYLYAAIGFSVIIEVFNQIAMSNYRKYQARRTLRERTAETILRLMGEKQRLLADENEQLKESLGLAPETIADEESIMISGVLTLGERSVRSLMTPRTEICWIDINAEGEQIRNILLNHPHSHYPLCNNNLDDVLGIGRAADIFESLRENGSLKKFSKMRNPAMAPESMDALRLIKIMRQSVGHLALAVDEFGSISGLITPIDVFGIIAGEFLDEDENPDIVESEGGILAQGNADLHHVEQYFALEGLREPDADYGTVAGLMLDKLGRLPELGEELFYGGLKFVVHKVSERRIEEVLILRDERITSEPETL